jgi:hypothetical protein
MEDREKPTEPRDAGTSKAPTGGDTSRQDAPVDALDAGIEGEAEPSGAAMTEDPPDEPTPPDEPAMAPNAMADAMPTVTGIWFGPAEDLLQRRYDTCTTITQVTTAGPAGTVKTNGALECEWDLDYIEFRDEEFVFDAIVRSGAGCFPNTLRLSVPNGDTLRFNIYINDGSIPDGAGTLARVDACP